MDATRQRMVMGSPALQIQTPPTVQLEKELKSLRGRVARTILRDDSTGFCVLAITESVSGRTVHLVGRLQIQPEGAPVALDGLGYGVDTSTRGYAYYLTEQTMDAVPAKGQVEPRSGQRRSTASAKRPVDVPLDRDVVCRYLADAFDGISKAAALQLLEAHDPNGEQHLLAALDSGKGDELARHSKVGATACRSLCAAWRQDAAGHRARIQLLSLGLGRRQVESALETAQRSQAGRANATPLDAVQRILRNPYGLTLIKGIHFATADRVARVIGVEDDSDGRLRAAAREALVLASRAGHTMQPLWQVAEGAAHLLSPDNGSRRRRGAPSFDPLRVARAIWGAQPKDGLVFPLGKSDAHTPVASAPIAAAESLIASRVVQMLAAPPTISVTPPTADELELICGHALDPSQVDAIALMVTSNMGVVTGGPGTGKTTIMRGLIAALEGAGLRVRLAAPTGLAARRLRDATGHAADTLHRTLGSRGATGYAHHSRNPLDLDVLIVDEWSMVDVLLGAATLDALPPGARLYCVGDQDQLPSIDAGAMLADLIVSGVPPVARLQRTFRQDGGAITELAANVRDGVPEIPPPDDKTLFVKHVTKPERIVKEVLDTVGSLRDSGVPASDIVVLAPMLKGISGVGALNQRLQRLLNPEGPDQGPAINSEMLGGRGSMSAGVGDRVMHRQNDRALELANGDVGTVLRVSRGRRGLIVDFGVASVEICGFKLEHLQLAYAGTVHKSQGSEFRHVILAISPEHRFMLRRNLLYTGITRAKPTVHLIGCQDSFIAGVYQTQDSQRQTLLAGLLRDRALEMSDRLVPFERQSLAADPLPPFEAQTLIDRLPPIQGQASPEAPAVT